eukprot:COSAG02_NODE_56858_length_283_cov_0.847826_1_plen_54_part_10
MFLNKEVGNQSGIAVPIRMTGEAGKAFSQAGSEVSTPRSENNSNFTINQSQKAA